MVVRIEALEVGKNSDGRVREGFFCECLCLPSLECMGFYSH